MINLATIQTNFLENKLVTFKESMNQDIILYDTQLKGTSESGLYYNFGTHPYLTSWQNMLALLPYFDDFQTAWIASLPAWDNLTTYSKGNQVKFNGNAYESLENSNVGNAPAVVTTTAPATTTSSTSSTTTAPGTTTTSSSTVYWTQIDAFSNFLKDLIKASIENVIKIIETKEKIVDNAHILRVSDIEDDLVTNDSKWVGFRFRAINTDHSRIIINQIGVQFTVAQTLTLYLYNQNTQSQTFTVVTLEDDFVWRDVSNIIMSEKEGNWYIFYKQDDISGQAVGNNTVVNLDLYQYAAIAPFEVAAGTDLNTIDESNFNWATNFGLNFNITIDCEYTNFITRHRKYFGEALQIQFAYDMLQQMASNPEARSNLHQRNINFEKVDFELTNIEGKFETVVLKKNRAIRELKKSLDKLGMKDICFCDWEEPDYTVDSL
jgi:hypothetical protein